MTSNVLSVSRPLQPFSTLMFQNVFAVIFFLYTNKRQCIPKTLFLYRSNLFRNQLRKKWLRENKYKHSGLWDWNFTLTLILIVKL